MECQPSTHSLQTLMNRGVSGGLFHGVEVLIARRNRLLFHHVCGTFDGVRPLAKNAIFDIASLTKPVATASLLAAVGLPLDDMVSSYLPGFKGAGQEQVTLRQLAAHNGGLPATAKFSSTCKNRAQARSALLEVPLEHAPGQRVVYSCVGYLLLGEVLETTTGKSLAQLFKINIADPLAMVDSCYTPLENGIDPARIVPAGQKPHRQGVAGIVHDTNAFVFGGVAGNAGLFSTAKDLHRFALLLLNSGRCGKEQILPSGAIAEMFQNQASLRQTPRTLGWELKLPGHQPPSCGMHFPDGSIGHTGFTGTSMWIEKKGGLVAILLSNRSALTHGDNLEDMRLFRHEFYKLAAGCGM